MDNSFNIKIANSQQGERARNRKVDSTNNISDLLSPKSSLAINGDGNPVDIQSVWEASFK